MATTHASMLGTNPVGTGTEQGETRGGARMCGALSVETFVNQSPLTLTHDDAAGWLEYLQRWHVPNFHFQDGGVEVLAYEEDYDNWQDTYGLDAVLAVYRSGHGGMGADGTFFAPLGASWDNRSDAMSTNMRLGNEVVNYIFWSTCNSLRVKEGHDPIRTWHAANLGFRMLFGFETISVDNASYGRLFWEEYNRPKSFARGGWMLRGGYPRPRSPRSSPRARAPRRRTRAWSTNGYSSGPRVNGYYSWWWYDRARALDDPEGVAQRELELPAELLIADLAPPAQTLEQLDEIARRHGVDLAAPSGPRAGLMTSEADGQALGASPDGRYELSLGEPNGSNAEALPTEEAKRSATASASTGWTATSRSSSTACAAPWPRAPRPTKQTATARACSRPRSSSASGSTGCPWSPRMQATCASRSTTTAG